MLMDTDVGEGGVKNQQKSADVVYGRPLMKLQQYQNPKLEVEKKNCQLGRIQIRRIRGQAELADFFSIFNFDL